MGMLAKIRRMHSARWAVHPRGEPAHRVVEEHGSAVVAPGGRDRTEVPQARGGQHRRSVDGAAGDGAEGRRSPAERDRRTAKMLFEQIQAQGYAGSYARVTACVRRWQAEQDACAAARGLRAAELRAGRSLPVRLELRVRRSIGGLRRRLEVAHIKLARSAGPSGWWPIPAQSHEMLFDAHARALRRLRRRPPPRHLRQHEDRGRQGRPRQGAHGQRALPGDVRPLPVRAGVLQPRPPAGRRASSRRTCRTGAARSGAKRASSAGRRWQHSTPGLASDAGRLG